MFYWRPFSSQPFKFKELNVLQKRRQCYCSRAEIAEIAELRTKLDEGGSDRRLELEDVLVQSC